MLKLSRTRLFAWRARAWIRDDSGVAALLVAAAIAVIAFTALSIFLNKLMGDRELRRVQSGASGQARVLPALYTFYLNDTGSGAPHRLPCPDTAATPTGQETGTCTGSGNYVGVIPWVTLGLSRSDVIDSYGNFYTYVMSGTASGVCESITKNYSATASMQEFTGKALTSGLEARYTSQAAGAGRKVPFAIIGHGKNGTGALSSGGTLTGTPSRAGEQANAASTSNASPPTSIFTGPTDTDTSSTTYFDDQVLVPSTADIQKICAQISPGGQINASVSDSFDNTTTTATNFDSTHTGVTVGATSTADSRNKVASFTASSGTASYLASNTTNFNFAPVARSVYVSAKWIGTSSTMSIATRGTVGDITGATDDFNSSGKRGITFRFSSAGAVIRNDGAELAVATYPTYVKSSSAGFTVVSGDAYLLEAYDDGADVWARISREDDPSVYATVRASGLSGDTAGEQRVFFINGTGAASELDDITIGFPMLALETTGSDSYVSASGASNGNGTSTGKLTLEAWVKPRALPTGNAAVIAKWNTNTSTGNGFRLRIGSTGTVYLDASRSAGEKTFTGPTISANEWTHIAVAYDYTATSETVSFFENGDIASSTTTTGLSSFTGINTSDVNFMVGADLNGSVVEDEFTGNISDVRVWKAARTAEDIRTNFQSRLSADTLNSAIDNLVVNWRLDSESLSGTAGLAFTSAATTPTTRGAAGSTVQLASLVPTLARYFRPLATSFCPGYVSGAYQCDFRITTANSANGAGIVSALTVPDSLLSVYAKVWGAGGGGGYAGTVRSPGGSGGYSAGKITSINNGTSDIAIYKLNANSSGLDRLKIVVGGYGGSSTDTKNGGGGGAGSGLYGYFSSTSANKVGLVAGGGGGGSYSSDTRTSCSSVAGTVTQCGLGGNGGGLTATMINAYGGSSSCGGRAGDNVGSGSGPPTTGGGSGNCDDGGGNNSLGNGGAAGTAGSAGGADGSANLMTGGRGADADTDNNNSGATDSNASGGGGGGGGAVGGEAGGHDHKTALAGYGGGGGSAAKDPNGVANATGAIGSYTVTAGSPFSDSATSGTFTSNNNAATTIPLVGKDPIAAGWAIGMTVTGGGGGSGIRDPSTITALTTSSVTVSQGQGGGSHSGITVSVSSTGTASLTSTPGGATDYHYKPSYVGSSYGSPGVGGYSTSSTTLNGTPGAVVLIW